MARQLSALGISFFFDFSTDDLALQFAEIFVRLRCLIEVSRTSSYTQIFFLINTMTKFRIWQIRFLSIVTTQSSRIGTFSFFFHFCQQKSPISLKFSSDIFVSKTLQLTHGSCAATGGCPISLYPIICSRL